MPPMSPADPQHQEKSLSILLVEDDSDARELFELFLLKRGHRVRIVGTGRDAIRTLGAEDFDVVIVDVLLPDGDGIEVISHMKEAKSPGRILAISGGGKYVDSIYCRNLALATGAHSALLKPFTGAELITAVEI
jgi:DNA-binding response OmpR family regulator